MIHTVNGSRREALRVVNALAAVVSGVAAVLARRDPAALVSGEPTPMADFYVDAYVARQLPLSAVLVGLLAARGGAGLRPLLLVAGLVQAADAAVGVRHAKPGMVVGSTVGAVVHLGSALLVSRWDGRRGAAARPAVPWRRPDPTG